VSVFENKGKHTSLQSSKKENKQKTPEQTKHSIP
jgi:hypothetical protein